MDNPDETFMNPDWAQPEQQNHRGGDAFVNPDWAQPEPQNHRGGDVFINPDRQNHRDEQPFVNPDWQQPEPQNHRNNEVFINPDREQQNHRNNEIFENPDRRQESFIDETPAAPPPVPNNNINQRPIARPDPNPRPFVRPSPRPTPQPHPVPPPPSFNQHRPQPLPPGPVNNYPAENKSLHPPGNPPPLRGLPPSYGIPQWKNKINVKPPQYDYNRMIQDAPVPKMMSDSRAIDSNEAHEIFVQWAESCCCYGKSCARESTITQCVPSYGIQYSLETFTEKRYYECSYSSYSGGHLDGPEMGPIPDLWMINAQPGQLFDSCIRSGKIPHTEQLINCFRCSAVGMVRCSSCNGKGRDSCNMCRGSGHGQNGICNFCNGKGYDNCSRCNGRGGVTCKSCHGTRRLKCFLEYEVHFTNRVDDFINETTDLPDELIKDVNGEILIDQTGPLLKPISQQYENRLVVDNSQRFFNKHFTYFQSEKPIMQRQRLKSVLVVECNYTWEDHNSRFWIYGNERKVYTEDYPQMCCCCCPCLCCRCCCDCCKCCSCTII